MTCSSMSYSPMSGLGFVVLLAPPVGCLPKSVVQCSCNRWCGIGRSRVLRICAASAMDESGLDSNGKTYESREQMWLEEAGIGAEDSSKKEEWYQKGISYWEGVEASIDGVLGGYGKVDSRDVVDSSSFLLEVLKERMPDAADEKGKLVALDCGAGVGRVTKNLLLRHFHEVDLVEPVKQFLDAARKDLTSEPPTGEANSTSRRILRKAVNFYCTPLQEFAPEPSRYDVIWVQWCIGHLTDDDFIAFFKRAQVGLKPGGFFVLKENIARHGFVVDKLDSSVTRSDAYFRDLFQRAGLHLLKSKLQKGFPRELFAVRMYALTNSLEEAPARSRSSKKEASVQSPKTIKQQARTVLQTKPKKSNQPKLIS